MADKPHLNLIVTGHIGAVLYQIIDMLIHNFHYYHTPLIAGYLILLLLVISFLDYQKMTKSEYLKE